MKPERVESRTIAWTLIFLAGAASLTQGEAGLLEDAGARRLGRFIESRKSRYPGAEADSRALARILVRESERTDLDPLLLLSIIETESKYRIRAIGSHGEQGLMQVKPTTAAWVLNGSDPGIRFDLFDPAVNVSAGASYLRWLRGRFGADLGRSIAAYNAGAKRARELASRGQGSFYTVLVQARYRDLRREWVQNDAEQAQTAFTTTPRMAFLR